MLKTKRQTNIETKARRFPGPVKNNIQMNLLPKNIDLNMKVSETHGLFPWPFYPFHHAPVASSPDNHRLVIGLSG